jgi:mRNA interferase RelE/StbE
MNYRLELKPRAIRDLKNIKFEDRARLLSNIEKLSDDLSGDVKRLTNFTPEFRLRVGNYRVLFEVDRDRVII